MCTSPDCDSGPTVDSGADRVSMRTNRSSLLHGISDFFSDLHDKDRGRIVVLCAEPYMDGVGVLDVLLRKAKSYDLPGFYVDFQGKSLVEPIIELGRIARNAASVSCERGATVCLNGLPSCDDVDVPRIVRPLVAMACHNCLVVISLAPEDMYLVDAIRGCRVYRSLDLMSLLWPSSDHNDRALFGFTHGIPSLVAAVKRFKNPCAAVLAEDLEYSTSLAYIVRVFLRGKLMNEERKMRCAAVLLGSGTYGELGEVSGSKSIELLDQSAFDAPFFGINNDARTFSCVGINTLAGLNGVYRIVADVCADYPDLPISVCNILLQRGDASRAALVCLLAHNEQDRKLLVISHAAAFFNAGEFTLLRTAVDDPPLSAYNDPRAVENACQLVESVQEDRIDPGVPFPVVNGESGSLASGSLALRFRQLLIGECLDVPVPVSSANEGKFKVACDLAEAVRLSLRGDLKSAYSQLIDCMSALDKEPPDVLSGVSTLAYAVVSTLVGVSLSASEQERLFDTRDFFESMGLSAGKAACDAALELIGLVAGRNVDAERIEVLSRKAERLGLTALHALCRLAQAVADLRMGAAMRAYVRLKGLIGESRDGGLLLLEAQARILLTAVAASMGDEPSDVDLGSEGSEVPELVPLLKTVDRVASKEKDGVLLLHPGEAKSFSKTPLRGSLPLNSLWMVDVLARDCGDFSRVFQDLLPRSWRRSLDQLSSLEVPERIPPKMREMTPGNDESFVEPSAPEGLRIEIFLLGRFSVKINGREIDMRKLERRRAKSLLALLALVPDHMLKRYAIIESIWPELDYESGIHRVYEATSVLRHKLVGPTGTQLPHPLLSNRMEHSMALNSECVWVDVDHFVGIVQRILASEGNDRLVVGLCRQAEGFYRGDLAIPPNDGLGVASRRQEQLRGLFADAMVAGSGAASRLGLRLTAARFARKAYVANDEREDALVCLIKALVATGRGLEAEREYRKFAVRVVENGHRPPSRELRKVVKELLAPNDGENDTGGESPARSA